MPRAESKSMDSAPSSAQSAETKTEEKQDFDENELLMYVAADANEHLFGEKSELTQFVNAHAADFETALDGDRTGAGHAHKTGRAWRVACAEYNEIMEEILEALVKKNDRIVHEGRAVRLGRRRGIPLRGRQLLEFVERFNDGRARAFHRIARPHKARSRHVAGIRRRGGVFSTTVRPTCRGGPGGRSRSTRAARRRQQGSARRGPRGRSPRRRRRTTTNNHTRRRSSTAPGRAPRPARRRAAGRAGLREGAPRAVECHFLNALEGEERALLPGDGARPHIGAYLSAGPRAAGGLLGNQCTYSTVSCVTVPAARSTVDSRRNGPPVVAGGQQSPDQTDLPPRRIHIPAPSS